MAQVATGGLHGEFIGELIQPGDPQYDTLRQVFNGSVDRHPALIARCTRPEDVIAAVNYARDHGLEIAVHGGGHGVRGHATCDGGVMVDLRPMKGIEIDAARRRARVQAGVTWRELPDQRRPGAPTGRADGARAARQTGASRRHRAMANAIRRARPSREMVVRPHSGVSGARASR